MNSSKHLPKYRDIFLAINRAKLTTEVRDDIGIVTM